MKKETFEKANRLTEKIHELKKLQTVGFEISISMFSDYTMSICDTDNEGYFNIVSWKNQMELDIEYKILSDIDLAEKELEAL